MTAVKSNSVFLVLGGVGLVGYQVCRAISRDLDPSLIVVASLGEKEALDACERLSREFSKVKFIAESGNLFVPTDLTAARREEIRGSDANRKRILDHIFGDFETAYADNALVRMILRHKPTVVVDCVNTATAISYQDVFGATARVREVLATECYDQLGIETESLLMSQGAPQLIRHVRMLYRATVEAGTRIYVKIGTTGTGGMGLNIPYTHSEDRPSNQLLNKTEIAFGHSGLLFLMSRTPRAPIVKEIKPAALIGYRAVAYRPITDREGRQRSVYEPRIVSLDGTAELELRESEDSYTAERLLETTVIDTGENGVFTRGEFGAITAIGQMEFVTPEEIARTVSLEIRGGTTGRNILGALDGSVMEPSYRAGMIRNAATEDLAAKEAQMDDHSVALGQLGPPELSKLLFEAHLIKETFGERRDALLYHEGDPDRPRDPAGASLALAEMLESHPVRSVAPSVGIPVLMPDGKRLIRGPKINVPEISGLSHSVPADTDEQIDAYARKGWVDLRAQNIERWQQRFHRMIEARAAVAAEGSAAYTLATYLSQSIEIGEVVAWIFNNEMGGGRMF